MVQREGLRRKNRKATKASDQPEMIFPLSMSLAKGPSKVNRTLPDTDVLRRVPKDK